MSDLPRWYALEAETLKAENKRLRELLRLCIPSLQKDGRPHVVTMVQAALGDITTDHPAEVQK